MKNRRQQANLPQGSKKNSGATPVASSKPNINQGLIMGLGTMFDNKKLEAIIEEQIKAQAWVNFLRKNKRAIRKNKDDKEAEKH